MQFQVVTGEQDIHRLLRIDLDVLGARRGRIIILILIIRPAQMMNVIRQPCLPYSTALRFSGCFLPEDTCMLFQCGRDRQHAAPRAARPAATMSAALNSRRGEP